MNNKFVIISLCVFSLAFVALNDLVDDWDTLEGSADNLEKFWNESLWPPNTDVWEPKTGEMERKDTLQARFVSLILFNSFVQRHGMEFMKQSKWHLLQP